FGEALHLPVFELDRGEPAENGNGNLEFAALGIDFVDAAGEVGEGTVGDLDLFAHGVLHLRHFLAGSGLDAGKDFINVGLLERSRTFATDKTDDAVDLFNEIPRLVDHLAVAVIEVHLDEDVARIELR